MCCQFDSSQVVQTLFFLLLLLLFKVMISISITDTSNEMQMMTNPAHGILPIFNFIFL